MGSFGLKLECVSKMMETENHCGFMGELDL